MSKKKPQRTDAEQGIDGDQFEKALKRFNRKMEQEGVLGEETRRAYNVIPRARLKRKATAQRREQRRNKTQQTPKEGVLSDTRRANKARLNVARKRIAAMKSGEQVSNINQQTLTQVDSTSLNEETVKSTILSIRISQEPLTAQNLSTIISALTELHTKCWLIAQGRFAELSNYTQTHSARYSEEADLVITDIIHNSPFNFDLSINPESVAKAMQLAIDSVSLAGLRKQEAELTIKAQELEMKLKQQEAQAVQDEKEQTRQVEALKAELERQKMLLEIEREQLEIEKQRFELQAYRIGYALKTAREMVDLLHPGLDDATKAMAAQQVIPNLLQLANGKGLELGTQALQIETKPTDSSKGPAT